MRSPFSKHRANEGDLDDCNKLCVRVHGHDRGPELLEAIKQGTATLVEHGGRVTGYATMVGFFGHAVGENNEDLKALIGAATAFPGPGFMLPTRNGELLRASEIVIGYANISARVSPLWIARQSSTADH